MCALDDLAAKLNMDSLEFFLKNIDLATKERQSTYREELGIAADLMGWKQKWHPRGQNASGNLARTIVYRPSEADIIILVTADLPKI
jgi:xanthine dehydrogenase YagR molybdenum-binding subunit